MTSTEGLRQRRGATKSNVSTNGSKDSLENNISNGTATNIKAEEVMVVPEEKVPPLLQIWRNLDAAMPNIPLFGANMGFAIFSFCCFIILRVLITKFLINVIGMDGNNSTTTKACAKSLVSFLHSSLMIMSTWRCLRSSPRKYNPSEKLNESPIWLQQSIHAILQFTTGYMWFDAVNLYMRAQDRGGMTKKDWGYLAHHFSAWIFPTLTRWTGGGHQTYLMCSFIGEFTNPWKDITHAIRQMKGQECCQGAMLENTSQGFAILFSVMYLPLRLVVGPIICSHITYHNFKYGRKHLRLLFIIIWNFMMWGILLSSAPWVRYSIKWARYGWQLFDYHYLRNGGKVTA